MSKCVFKIAEVWCSLLQRQVWQTFTIWAIDGTQFWRFSNWMFRQQWMGKWTYLANSLMTVTCGYRQLLKLKRSNGCFERERLLSRKQFPKLWNLCGNAIMMTVKASVKENLVACSFSHWVRNRAWNSVDLLCAFSRPNQTHTEHEINIIVVLLRKMFIFV